MTTFLIEFFYSNTKKVFSNFHSNLRTLRIELFKNFEKNTFELGHLLQFIAILVAGGLKRLSIVLNKSVLI